MRQTTVPVITITRTVPEGALLLEGLKQRLSIDFNEHDTQLSSLLATAQARVEKLTSVLLTPATVTASWLELYDWESLPWGPVTGTITAEQRGSALTVEEATSDGSVSPGGALIEGAGSPFPRLVGDYPLGIKLTYTAGYALNGDDLDAADLKESVVQLAANLFDGGNRDWKSLCLPHRRKTWVL